MHADMGFAVSTRHMGTFLVMNMKLKQPRQRLVANSGQSLSSSLILWKLYRVIMARVLGTQKIHRLGKVSTVSMQYTCCFFFCVTQLK